MTITTKQFDRALLLTRQVSTLEKAIKGTCLGVCNDMSDFNSSNLSWNKDIDLSLRSIAKDIFNEATDAMNARLEDELSRVKLELASIIKDDKRVI